MCQACCLRWSCDHGSSCAASACCRPQTFPGRARFSANPCAKPQTLNPLSISLDPFKSDPKKIKKPDIKGSSEPTQPSGSRSRTTAARCPTGATTSRCGPRSSPTTKAAFGCPPLCSRLASSTTTKQSVCNTTATVSQPSLAPHLAPSALTPRAVRVPLRAPKGRPPRALLYVRILNRSRPPCREARG